jgi:cell division protein FtsI (penicillin-binding protein 3)
MAAVAVACGAALLLLVARAVDLGVLRGPGFVRLAAKQHRQRIGLVPHRGPIVDRNGEALALSLDVPSIYVRPREVDEPERLGALAAALGMPAATLHRLLDGGKPFVWLKRQALPREAAAVQALGLRGVYTVAEGRRFYPHHDLAAHVLGLVGVDAQGLEGLERAFDHAIRGEGQSVEVDRDARGRALLTRGVQGPPAHGSRVELTLDAAIQDAAERELAAGAAASGAVAGTAVVLDPATGEILALANVPTYNPNRPGRAKDRRWRERVRNRALTDPYEPGSTFKAVLAAAAIEEKVVSPTEMIFCENGRFPVGRWTINDAHPHGWLSFAEVIQYSSNIGVTKIAERLGRERYGRYLTAFGFGQRTGIELTGESPGILRSPERWGRIDLATHAFGQGISVTPLQMVAAFGAIANGGRLMRPFLVRRVVAPDGTVTLEHEPTLVRRVVSERSAHVVTTLLRRVVEERGGTGTRARLDGFPVAGKTGTAQKVNLETGGYSAKRIGSFVGFVPADAPRAVILVLIDEPRTSSYGGIVAAPVFRAIASAVLKRLGVDAPAPPAEAPSTPAKRPAAPARGSVQRVTAPDEPGGTPSFLGLSLREALTRAQATGWEVQVTGSGWVREQRPAPGSPLAADRRLALWLVPGGATASP